MTPIAVGVDLVEVDRIRTAIERTPGLEAKVFTADEIAYSRSARQPWERFAARWAAKEAVVKCLGGGVPGVDLREVEVVRCADGAPSVAVRGEAARRATERGIDSWLVSMTHTASMAEAVVIALGPPVG